MPASTPNRLYPYPLPGDPVDVPGDIQRLAEAIDDDFTTLIADIGPRKFCQISSITPQVAETQPIVGVLNRFVFDTIDHDNAGLVQTSNGEVSIVIPDTDYYWVYAEINTPQINGTAATDPSFYIEVSNTSRAFRAGVTNNTADESTGGLAPTSMHMSGIFQQASQVNRTLQTVIDFAANKRKLTFGIRRMGAISFRHI